MDDSASDDSTMSPPPVKKICVCSVSSQRRGFRDSLLYYLKKNASPKLLIKLMKVSRYFWYSEMTTEATIEYFMLMAEFLKRTQHHFLQTKVDL